MALGLRRGGKRRFFVVRFAPAAAGAFCGIDGGLGTKNSGGEEATIAVVRAGVGCPCLRHEQGRLRPRHPILRRSA
eukprot:444782-Pyramimonas_sp.AAC.1